MVPVLHEVRYTCVISPGNFSALLTAAHHPAVWNLFCTPAVTEEGAPGSLKAFVPWQQLWQRMPVLLIQFLGNISSGVEIPVYPCAPCSVLEVPLEGSRCFGNGAERRGCSFPALS